MAEQSESRPGRWLVYWVVRWIAMPIMMCFRAIGWLISQLVGPKKAKESDAWANCRNNQFAFPTGGIERPQSLEQLLAAVRKHLPDGPDVPTRVVRRVRAIGSGHSFSDVGVSDDVIVNMRGLREMLPVPESDGAPWVVVQAGMTVRELNAELHANKLALLNMGAYDGQTISGVISTATHGSGWKLGHIGDAVLAVQLVDGRGRFLQIQPTDTEPIEMPADVEPELICDDTTFHAAIVAMGSMGIAYAYALKVRDAHLLNENRTAKTWEEVRDLIAAGAHTEAQHWECLVNPYVVGKRRDCLITRRVLADKPARTQLGRTRNPVSTLVTSFRFFDRLILWLFLKRPTMAPSLLRAMVTGLVDKTYIDDSFKVLNLGEANYVPAFSSELGLDASDPEELLRALEDLLNILADNAPHGRRVTIPLSLRFVAPSEHLLAPMYQRPTCMVEIGVIEGTPHAWDFLRYIERQMTARWGARPHWGQANTVTAETARQLFAESFEPWRQVYLDLNPHGLFDNAFTNRLGLRPAPSSDTDA